MVGRGTSSRSKELGLTLGVDVGYRIRGETVPGEHLSFATAGYLLSWLTADPNGVKSMTHLILDEAHIRGADMELLLLLVRLVMRINDHLRVILMSATMEASFFDKYFKEFSPPKPLYVGGRLYPIEVFHLDDLAQGYGPKGKLSKPLKQELTKARTNAFKEGDLLTATRRSEDVPLEKCLPPLLKPNLRQAAEKLIPEIAKGGSTVLVFIPGYADLNRMHSWLYWNLPTVGSVNMGFVPPKPEELVEDQEEEEEEDLEEFQQMQGSEGPLSGPMRVKNLSDIPSNGEGSAGSGLKYRLFALHSQVAQQDQELVLQPPPPNICNVAWLAQKKRKYKVFLQIPVFQHFWCSKIPRVNFIFSMAHWACEVVLATTIAESSLTLPEVIGVIDFCLHKTCIGDPSQMGLSKLVGQWCARSACLQREGRAGRTQPGWCIRMVPEELFNALREYDVPEILRTPLSTLYLKAKGIADGLSQIVQDDEVLAKQLRMENATPSDLLQALLAPPSSKAINAAVHQLAQLAVLTEDSVDAKVTVLGRLALFLPLDVQLGRLVWLGSLLGCPAEAVVLAAACSVPSPFANPSRRTESPMSCLIYF